MVKRLVIALLLFSMMLHSAGRLGVLSYLYQQRHHIAYALGVIAEVPIAMCSSNYQASTELHIHDNTGDDESTVPPASFQAKEIQLYFSVIDVPGLHPNRSVVAVHRQAWPIERAFASPPISIFHPPS